MDLNLRSSSSSTNLNFNRSRSTIFDASIEQADISMRKLQINREILNLNGEPTSLRSSSTYSSSVFQAPSQYNPKPSAYKPNDNITSTYFGKEPSDFYRKSITSDFQPNFKPKYSNTSVWAVNNSTFQPTTPTKTPRDNWIKPISKRSVETSSHQQVPRESHSNSMITSERSNSSIISSQRLQVRKLTAISGVYQRSTRASSRSTSRIHSRTITPQPQAEAKNEAATDVFSDPFMFSTEDNLCVENQYSGRNRPKFSLNCADLLGREGNLRSNREAHCQGSGRNKNLGGKVVDGEDKENRRGGSGEGKTGSRSGETEEDPQKNYAMILKVWNQKRFISKYSDPAQRKIGPGYLRNTISSFSKCRKTGQSMHCLQNALGAL